MLTQTMPAVVEALVQNLPEQAIRALTQALGNCNQPLTHRGSLNIQPYVYGNRRGVYTGQRWNPNDYKDILPNAGESDDVDLPGFRAGDWNSVNYGGGNFFFPTDQFFDESNFYGGPTTNIGGDTNFETINATTINVTNINTTNINGGGGGGGPGGGGGGPATDPGVPGDPNYGEPISPPVGGGTGSAGYRSKTIRYLRDVEARDKPIKVVANLSLEEIEVAEWVTVLTDVTFNANNCTLTKTFENIPVYELEGTSVVVAMFRKNVAAVPVELRKDEETITVLVP